MSGHGWTFVDWHIKHQFKPNACSVIMLAGFFACFFVCCWFFLTGEVLWCQTMMRAADTSALFLYPMHWDQINHGDQFDWRVAISSPTAGYVVSLNETLYLCLALVQPRKTGNCPPPPPPHDWKIVEVKHEHQQNILHLFQKISIEKTKSSRRFRFGQRRATARFKQYLGRWLVKNYRTEEWRLRPLSVPVHREFNRKYSRLRLWIKTK